MYKALVFSLLLVIAGCAAKQTKLKIPYVLPYGVTKRIIEEIKEDKPAFYYCILGQSGDVFTITLSTAKAYREIEVMDSFGRVKSTNRFIIAGPYTIPLLFTADFLFSTRQGFAFTDSADVYFQYFEKGIARSITSCDYCLTIIFTKNGQIISENYGAAKKVKK